INSLAGKNEVIVDRADHSKITYNIQANDNIGQIQRSGVNTLARYYYLKDQVGSIKMTVNASGNVVGYDDYFPYGSIMPIRSHVSSEFDRYKFTGKYRDGETGYDYFGARYYDSWLGGFLSVDPMSKKYPSFSPYNYTLDNPLRLVDPHGESWADPYKGPLCCKTYPRTTIEFGNNFTSFLTTKANDVKSKVTSSIKTTLGIVTKTSDKVVKNANRTTALGLGMIAGGAILAYGSDGVLGEYGLPMMSKGVQLTEFSLSVGTYAESAHFASQTVNSLAFGSGNISISELFKLSAHSLIDVGMERLLPGAGIGTVAVRDVTKVASKQIIDNQINIQQ
ncbi:MAG TPA: RHS repeat-associated core domain-containing protein, partial [Balneolales bacterium]|nr:RHS repeat-associated core domain-containing protein [Balneolales bacterium]